MKLHLAAAGNRDSVHVMKWGNWLIGACCALFVAVVVIPTGAYEGVWKLLVGDKAADWVQAIGSIFSIIAAGGFVSWQIVESRRQGATEREQAATSAQKQALQIMRLVTLKIFAFEGTIVQALENEYLTDDQLEMIMSGIEGAKSMLSQVSIAHVDDEVMNELFILEAICSITPAQIRGIKRSGPTDGFLQIKKAMSEDLHALTDALNILDAKLEGMKA